MKFDVELARSSYDLDSGTYVASNFAQFSPAYVVTNENVRDALGVLQPHLGARVLTVAGSGDQALFYKLAGASLVDTFDITFNAKMMMDIKTVAIQVLSQVDYMGLLQKIKHSRNIEKIPYYQQIKDYLPADTRDYVNQMSGVYLTRGGSYLDNVLYKNEYEKARELIKKPFNFIWTDLTDLASHLTQTYDQIYLSNILQYRTDPEYLIGVIGGLVPYLAPQGKILVNIAPWFNGEELATIRALQRNMEESNIAMVNRVKNHWHHMCILKKR